MVDPGEHGLVAVVVQAVLKELVDHLVVWRGLQLPVLQQPLDLAGEEQAAGTRRASVVQRLDAEVVTVEDELATDLTQVGDRERPHTVEARGAGRSPLLIGVDDDLAVALGAEGVPRRLKLGAQLAVVVDLAVVDEPDSLVFVGEGLMAPGAIDDAQAAVPEAYRLSLERSSVVRSAMDERGGHAAEELTVW